MILKGIFSTPQFVGNTMLVNQRKYTKKKKKMIYESTVSYYKTKYKLRETEVLGLMVGARGTIPHFFVNT